MRIFPRLLTKLYQKFAILKRVRIISFRLAACGGKEAPDNKEVSEETASTTEEVIETEAPETQPVTGIKVAKSIDAVAEALGLTNGEKNFYDVIGAIDGKEYNNGNVELYLYDESSEKYQKILAGKGSTKIAAYKNGVVLLFPVGSKPDQEIINKFNELIIE